MPVGAGEKFAGYTIVRRLGAGGMGQVYLAQHPRLPRSDALKLLGSNVSADPSFHERFLREADLASTLYHPHIVGVHDRGEYQGQLWISMDFVDGVDADGLMARRYPAGMPPKLAATTVTAVASALDYAHNKGLLHRDVKPANIMITNVDDEAQRRILLTDFGIARTIDDASGLTGTNMTLGTVAYAAPEQLIGDEMDGRTDQYALAATAFHLLTGAPPFGGSNPAVVIGRHLNARPPSLANTRPELAALDPVLAKALAKDREHRFATCSDFARALDEQASGKTSAPKPVAPTVRGPAEHPPTHPPTEVGMPQNVAPPTAAALSPGWYPDPNGKPGQLYWDGQGWRSAPLPKAVPQAAAEPQRRRTATPWIWVLGIAVIAGIVIGLILFAWSRTQGSSPSPSPTTSPTEAPVTAAPPSTVITKTVPQQTGPSTNPVPPQPKTLTAAIVGVCDEGGTCGLKQRTAPYNAAPSLYPTDLRDGDSVTVACQVVGDTRENKGYGSSKAWYRLDNGAYIASVYTNLPPAGVPAC